ncbi:sugar kinase [Actinophytocola sp. NPDC049390]|uniref:sugar kinase n=1 Tax=Actinophytocola sp. NPDC049390 TaxID=3363894 RepID=UPI0037B0475A
MAPRYDVTAIGEGGLRLSVPSGDRLEVATSLDVNVVGTEANVVSSLARLGWRTGWASAVPDGPLGRRVENALTAHGVDIGNVVRVPGARVGSYFVEYGAAPRPTLVHFDRAGTAFTQLTPEQVNWDSVLDTRLIHLTGLTVPLSDGVHKVVEEAFSRARDRGVPVSFDVNFRARLWTCEEAAAKLRPFVESADILFCRHGDARQLFGFGPTAEDALAALCEMSSARHVLVSSSEHGVVASVDGRRVTAPACPVDIVDRLGAGDGLAAGFLHGWLSDDLEHAPMLATAMAALALSQRGEQVITTRQELADVMADPNTNLNR